MLGATAATLFALLILLFCALIAALGTGWGTRLSLQLASDLLPELSIDDVHGDWLSGLHVGSVSWRDEDTEFTLTGLHTRLRWLRLMDSQIQLQPLHAARIELVLKGESTPGPVQLPALWLPVPLLAPDLQVGQFDIVSDADTTTSLHELSAGVRWAGAGLQMTKLALRWEALRVAADGTLQFSGDYPLRLRASATEPQLPGTVAANIDGTLRQLRAAFTLDGEWPLSGAGEVALLDDNLPLKATVQLAKPGSWSGGGETVTIHSAAVELHGDLTGVQGQLAAVIEEQRYGKNSLQAPWHWQPGQLQIAPQLQVGSGSLQADCKLALEQTLAWSCNGQAQKIPLQPLLQEIAGELSGALQVNGSYGDHLQLEVTLPDFSGSLADESVGGQLQLRSADGELWQLPRFELRAGPNRVSASGEFGSRNNLQIELDAGDLQRLYPRLRGSARANLNARGTWPNPDLSGRIDASQLHFDDIALAQAEGSFELPRLGQADSRLQLELRELSVPGQEALAVTLNATGSRATHQLDLRASQRLGQRANLRCNGRIDAAFSDWQLDCPQLRGRLRHEHGTIAVREAGPVSARWQIAADTLEVKPFCLNADGGALCLEQTLRMRSGRLETLVVQGRDLPLAWGRPYLPEGLSLENDARGNLQVQLKSLQPLQLDAAAQIPETRWQWLVDDKTQAATLQNLQFKAALNEQRAELSASVDSPTLGSFAAQLEVGEPRGRRTLQGHIDIQRLQLGGFAWLVQGLDALSGQIDGRVNIEGSAQAVRLNGQIQLENGIVGWAPLGDLVQNIRLTARFDNDSADFKGGFALGGGTGSLDGGLNWQEEGNLWDLRMQVDAAHIAIAPLPDSRVVLAPKVQVQITPSRFSTTGKVTIEEADIRVKELPPDTVDVSPDEEIVGREVEAGQWQMLANVELDLGDKFHFRGFGADVNLTGGLRLQRDSSQLFRANGEVKVKRGRYRAYGQRLLVRRGSFIFTGPWDNPDLNLQAIRELPPSTNPNEVVVGIQVSGPLRAPNAVLFSEPGMPESDIAYYLLTGQPRATTQTNQFSAGGTLLALGLAGGGDQAEKLAKQFGISDFQIGTVEGAGGVEAEVSGYLSPKLYVRYGRGIAQGSNSVTFQYRLTPRLLVETISGIESALDLLYSFTLD